MTVFRSRRAVLPGGEQAADVVVDGGLIVAIEPYGHASDDDLIDCGDDALLPGLVDTHVHVNEPGRTEWEGFETATKAAAAGGVTTVLDMPLNSLPPTTTLANLEAKRAATAGKLHVNVGFWGGAIGTNTADLAELHEAGVFGFKAFLAPSGVPEFPHLTYDTLPDVLAEVARLDSVLIVHAEDADMVNADVADPHAANPDEVDPDVVCRSYLAFVATRPAEAEHVAVEALLDAARRAAARVHVLHVSSAGVLPLVTAARDGGVAVTVETCPHYLSFTAEDVPDGATEFTCCPPIRGASNREALWRGLAIGDLDLIVSDHSPCPAELKAQATGDFSAAWGGISSLQLGLSAVWTEARARGHELADVVRWMSTAPASFAGLATKGSIAVGKDADLVAFDTEAQHTVDPAQLHHRHPITPYAGRTLRGVVRGAWLAGQQVDFATPTGVIVSKESA